MESPFPSWAAPLSRFLFSVPQWVMIGGIVLAGIVFVGIAAFVWLRREALLAGWRARSPRLRMAATGGVAALVLVGVGLGWQSWSFMQHDNDFCQSCHIMDVPFQKFTTSEHSTFQCHDCHQQPISASIRQVYLWVLDRPEDIGEHAPVPNTVCGTCHIQQDPDSVWQRIVATAGHRVHLESDSLPDLMCVRCHGVEIHRFVPVDQTCGQSGCHEPEKTQVVLGSMAGQNDLHCVACHRFTAPVTEEAALDTARAALVPHQEQCFSCHQMRDQLVTFDPELEPHGLLSRTYGFFAWPPRPLHPLEECVDLKFAHSLRLVLPRMMAPASRSFFAMKASCGGIEPSSAYDPAVVVMRSCVSMLSLMRTGIPCIGPRVPRDFLSSSSDFAIAIASGLISRTARSAGPLRSMSSMRSR